MKRIASTSTTSTSAGAKEKRRRTTNNTCRASAKRDGSKTIVDQDGRPDDEEKCNSSRKNSVEIKKCVSTLAAASSKKNADSPLLRVLPFVISGGYLCNWEYFSPVITCKSIHRIWVEDQHTLPESSLVDIRVQLDSKRDLTYPLWATSKGLENILPSPKFGRTVFEKLCELKVAVETNERKKQKIREALPKLATAIMEACISRSKF